MLFLSKLLPLFFYPLGLSLTLALLACVFWRRKKVGLGLLLTSIGILWLSSTFYVSHHLVTSLEWRYLPIPTEDMPEADAIVLLGGAVSAPRPPRVEIELFDAADRVLHAARLYRAGKAPIVIVSGGALPWTNYPYPEAPIAKTLLQDWGVPAAAILIDSNSRNTYENAVNTKRLVEEHSLRSILLVTSALHMPRAMASFRSIGIEAIPAPTDYMATRVSHHSILDLLPSVGALSKTTLAVKEYIGLVYYRWRWGVRDEE